MEGIGGMEQRDLRKYLFPGRVTLQIIAVLAMVFDHFACIFLQPYNSVFPFGEEMNTVIYEGFRAVGRVSFPIFCFLLVQGFQMTQSLKKYMLRLFLFAILSEIPYDLAFSGVVVNWREQNVLFTLFIGLIVLERLKQFETNWTAKGIFVLAGCMLAFIFQTDYSYFGILLIAVMYILRDNRLQQMFWAALLIFSQGGMEIYAVFALLLCYFYQQDKKERRLPRYFLYTFYPLHLFVFWILYCAI